MKIGHSQESTTMLEQYQMMIVSTSNIYYVQANPETEEQTDETENIYIYI